MLIFKRFKIDNLHLEPQDVIDETIGSVVIDKLKENGYIDVKNI